MKRFTVHFRHRQTVGKTLEDVFEETLAPSKAAAIQWGKSIANERGWWFMGAERGGAA